MSRQRQRRRLSVQPLETRKLMAGDAFKITGVDDAIIDGTQTTAVFAADEISISTGKASATNPAATDASGFVFIDEINNVHEISTNSDTTDAVMARYQRLLLPDPDFAREILL